MCYFNRTYYVLATGEKKTVDTGFLFVLNFLHHNLFSLKLGHFIQDIRRSINRLKLDGINTQKLKQSKIYSFLLLIHTSVIQGLKL